MLVSEGLVATRTTLTWVACGDVWSQAAVDGHVWVHVPNAAGVCDDVQGLYYPKRQ